MRIVDCGLRKESKLSHRFFVEPPIAGDRVTLSGTEAHHLLHVMRAREGQEVTLFDGSGSEFVARIESTRRHDVELSIVSRQAVDRELPLAIHLGVALPKGDRQAWLVEKAVELGVASLIPLITQRGVAQPRDAALSRLRRGVIEASKQCGRNRLMQIEQPQVLSDFVQHNAPLRWLAHTGGQPLAEMAGAPAGLRDAWLAIGPEGGFTEDEVQLAVQAGWQVIDLGPRVLRVETAALMLAATVGARCNLPIQ